MPVFLVVFRDAKLLDRLEKDFDKILPLLLVYDRTEYNNPEFTKKIAEFYLGKKHIDKSLKQQFTQVGN